MDKAFCKDLMYAGMAELMSNRRYYYTSSVGSSYSHWTDEGKIAVMNLVELITPKIHEAEHRLLDDRAKEMVMSGLKGKKD